MATQSQRIGGDFELGDFMGACFEKPVLRPPRYVSVKDGWVTFLDETGAMCGGMSEATYKEISKKFPAKV